MTTTSFPAKGSGGFAIDKWAEYFDAEDGIVNDYDGTSLSMQLTGNNARYAAGGEIRVAGYTLKITAAHDLSPGDSSTGTFWTWACYDPALNVDVGGVASTDGPVRLGMSSGAPSTTGNKQYCLIDKITRSVSSSVLTGSPVESFRRWQGPVLYMDKIPAVALAETATVGWAYPVGTTIITPAGVYQRQLKPGGGVWWAPLSGSAVAWPLPSGLEAASTTTPMYWRDAFGTVHAQGTVQRNSGLLTSGSDVPLGTLPVGYQPDGIVRGVLFAKPPSGRGMTGWEVASTGAVTLYGPAGGSLSWVDLSMISFRAKGF